MSEQTTLPVERPAETLPAERPAAMPPARRQPENDDRPLVAIMQRVAEDPDFDVEKLRELRAIQKEWDAEQERKAYLDALARAQETMPIVKKNRHVYFESRQAGKPATDYWHADYGNLVDTIKPHLTREGLSYDHDIVQADGRITVTCILSHAAGHSKSVVMSAPPDDTGGKNPIQQVKSTVTYLKRATLEAVTGAATEDDDDDGRGYEPVETISEDQYRAIADTMNKVGADREAFVQYLGVESLSDLPAADYGKAMRALDAKAAKAREQQTGAGDAGPGG